MKPTERAEVRDLLPLPYETAEWKARKGFISDRAWRLYQSLWVWGAARFAGQAGNRQDQFATALGFEALLRRRERIKRIVEAL